ncbi:MULTISPECIES: hypothetical protein [unclassified Neisseria]|nr:MULTISPECIES: hypothetical protein [unclassified Neisseria]MDO1510422.1 hypothetical protein [Neisseria sp. MVDL19-042950]MDO1516591.1 hypothetical protein [Neisseria sp. MVDL18-041461]MDO1563737.1 hypothetical protein [Neisseria sp. MVDL20-010259]
MTAHTDSQGHTTAYEYGRDDLPTQRTFQMASKTTPH